MGHIDPLNLGAKLQVSISDAGGDLNIIHNTKVVIPKQLQPRLITSFKVFLATAKTHKVFKADSLVFHNGRKNQTLKKALKGKIEKIHLLDQPLYSVIKTKITVEYNSDGPYFAIMSNGVKYVATTGNTPLDPMRHRYIGGEFWVSINYQLKKVDNVNYMDKDGNLFPKDLPVFEPAVVSSGKCSLFEKVLYINCDGVKDLLNGQDIAGFGARVCFKE